MAKSKNENGVNNASIAKKSDFITKPENTMRIPLRHTSNVAPVDRHASYDSMVQSSFVPVNVASTAAAASSSATVATSSSSRNRHMSYESNVPAVEHNMSVEKLNGLFGINDHEIPPQIRRASEKNQAAAIQQPAKRVAKVNLRTDQNQLTEQSSSSSSAPKKTTPAAATKNANGKSKKVAVVELEDSDDDIEIDDSDSDSEESDDSGIEYSDDEEEAEESIEEDESEDDDDDDESDESQEDSDDSDYVEDDESEEEESDDDNLSCTDSSDGVLGPKKVVHRSKIVKLGSKTNANNVNADDSDDIKNDSDDDDDDEYDASLTKEEKLSILKQKNRMKRLLA